MLPETGEVVMKSLPYVGGAVILVVLLFILFKRRKKKNPEDK